MEKIKKLSYVFLIVIAIHSIWFVVQISTSNSKIFLPTIADTYKALFLFLKTKAFWLDVSYSIYRVVLGFLISFIVAYPLSLLSIINSNIKALVFYFVEFFRYLPIPVFIPLTVLWFGVGDFGKIVIIFLGTFSQMIPLFYDSAIQFNSKYNSLTNSIKWSKGKVLSKIIVPGSLPLIIDNSRICFGWAWSYLVIAELLGAENGLGFSIIRFQRFLATDKIFAYIIVIGFIGLISDRLLLLLRKKMFQWY